MKEVKFKIKDIYGTIYEVLELTHTKHYTVDSNMLLHSFDDKPGRIEEWGDKSVSYWYKHGSCHRLTGPAFIWTENKFFSSYYFIHGKQLSKENWENEVNRIQMLNEI